jgi:cation:H+ antiporter
MILCNIGQGISRIDAVILVALFIAFIAYTIIAAKKSKEMQKAEDAGEEKITAKSVMKDILFIILGIATLKIGGDLTVDNATNVARMFNVSEKIIGLTILAIGTSLPELVTSVTAAIKGNSDIAIGNIIGSNIFNVLLILGVASTIKPLIVSTVALFDIFFMTFTVIMFICLTKKDRVLTKSKGIFMVLVYIGYLITTILR